MSLSGPLVDAASVPDWLAPLVRRTAGLTTADLGWIPAPAPGTGRRAAVLVLFGQHAATGDPDVLLQLRADTLPSHAGQACFPGGSVDDTDDGPVATALREAAEEVGVQSGDVRPLAVMPQLYLPPSDFVVTPVLAHWQRPGPVCPVDPGETAAVARVPLPALADPANRVIVRGPSGLATPGFLVPGMLVWGFTGGLLDALLAMGGWERPWRPAVEHDLNTAWGLIERTEVIR